MPTRKQDCQAKLLFEMTSLVNVVKCLSYVRVEWMISVTHTSDIWQMQTSSVPWQNKVTTKRTRVVIMILQLWEKFELPVREIKITTKNKHYGLLKINLAKSILILNNLWESMSANHEISWVIQLFNYWCIFFHLI